MEGSAPHPLRPYYVPPAPDASWSSSLSAAAAPAGPCSSRLATTASTVKTPLIPTTNRYESNSSLIDGVGGGLNAGLMLKAFVTSSLLSFTSTALVMPFEVGKTLSQVQWVPRDGVEPTIRFAEPQLSQSANEEAIEVSVSARGRRSKQSRRSDSLPSLRSLFSSRMSMMTTSQICHQPQPLHPLLFPSTLRWTPPLSRAECRRAGQDRLLSRPSRTSPSGSCQWWCRVGSGT